MAAAVNLAARLVEVSEQGEIFVGPDTHRLTDTLFVYETLEPIHLKGKSDPVQIYRLIRVRKKPGNVRGLAGLESAMVGRDVEVASLLVSKKTLKAGQGGIALITGEPGLGKTRLITEWKAALDGQPLKVVQGRCLSYGQKMAYHMLVDLLHSVLGAPPGTEPSKIRAALRTLVEDLFPEAQMEVYPYLAHLLSLSLDREALELVRDLDPLALKAQYQKTFRRLFSSLAFRQPLIVILEDIHWADPSSTDLLVKLLPLILDNPLLFCGVARSS
ncbi:MAG: hypothetical protein AMJ56_15990 [Anaerolineae bacterium SG8_19]|nr:MAG: hypothetical protein AMJ56_15990 [Anaerolineae bacterium SG8_19]HCB50356.1 hypothetical protein [Chloroflexota bacterium]